MYNRSIFQMRRSSTKLFFCSFLFLLIGCQDVAKTKMPKAHSRYSHWLKYKKSEYGIAVFILDPDHQQATKKLFFTQQPDRCKELSNSFQIIDTRNPKIATTSATQVGMLVALNARDHVYAVAGGKFLYDPQLKRRFNQGKLLETGHSNEIPFESLVKKKVGFWISDGMEAMDASRLNRFTSLGMLSIPDYDWRETHPLGKAEWLLLFGALTNQFESAEILFNGICNRYKEYAEKMPKGNACQRILVGNFAGDFWYSPLGDSFQAKLLSEVDFCTFSMNTKGTGSLAADAETIFNEAEVCQLWINPGFDSKKRILASYPKANLLKPFREGKIYCYAHNLNKYWEQSATKPDMVLKDLLQIKRGFPKGKMYFYKEVK